jgi:hypothetical protein
MIQRTVHLLVFTVLLALFAPAGAAVVSGKNKQTVVPAKSGVGARQKAPLVKSHGRPPAKKSTPDKVRHKAKGSSLVPATRKPPAVTKSTVSKPLGKAGDRFQSEQPVSVEAHQSAKAACLKGGKIYFLATCDD